VSTARPDFLPLTIAALVATLACVDLRKPQLSCEEAGGACDADAGVMDVDSPPAADSPAEMDAPMADISGPPRDAGADTRPGVDGTGVDSTGVDGTGVDSAGVDSTDGARVAGLVGHWKLDEASGQLVADASGGGADGFLGSDGTSETIDPVRAGGKTGGALDFDGADDQVLIPATPQLANLEAFTYLAWIYLESGTTYPRIVSREDVLFDEFYFLVSTPNPMALSASITNTDGKYFLSTAAPNSVAFQTWHRVAVTFDNKGDRKLHLFVDGKEVVYKTEQPMTGTLRLTNHPLLIGRRPDGSGFRGLIDDVKAYNRALSPAEIVTEQ
jgi:hypothetical protein